MDYRDFQYQYNYRNTEEIEPFYLKPNTPLYPPRFDYHYNPPLANNQWEIMNYNQHFYSLNHPSWQEPFHIVYPQYMLHESDYIHGSSMYQPPSPHQAPSAYNQILSNPEYQYGTGHEHEYPSHDKTKRTLIKEKSKNKMENQERIGRITVLSVNTDYTVWIPVSQDETGLSLAQKIRNIATMRTKIITSIRSNSGINIPITRQLIFDDELVDINGFQDGERWTVKWCQDDRSWMNTVFFKKMIKKLSLPRKCG
ncbi:hypothetical protein K501DRAFT_335620 [Backusella circina FSU 941]|nr:hypothetical protein K501DRAFT_335620 [Backusella circina FSU 941]